MLFRSDRHSSRAERASLLPLERNACLPGCVWNATPRSRSPLERNIGFWTQASVPLQGRQGSRGCIPDAPGETDIPFEWKQRTPLCSRVVTGISLSSLGGLKGVKPPEALGERSRDWPLGHAGDEGPHLRDDGGVSGWFSSGGPRVRFLTRCDGRSEEHTSELQSQ